VTRGRRSREIAAGPNQRRRKHFEGGIIPVLLCKRPLIFIWRAMLFLSAATGYD
jgi:hypothetical protein